MSSGSHGPVIGIVAGIVVIAAIAVSEYMMPGYGFGSRLVQSSETIATARKAEADRITAEGDAAEKRITDYNERIRKYHEDQAKIEDENSFLRSSRVRGSKIVCPDAKKWAALTLQDQQRWHSILTSRNLQPLINDCYLFE